MRGRLRFFPRRHSYPNNHPNHREYPHAFTDPDRDHPANRHAHLAPTSTHPRRLDAHQHPTSTLEPTATSEPVPAGSTPTSVPTETKVPTITPTPTVYTTKIYSGVLKDYYGNVSHYGISRSVIEDSFRSKLLREKLLEAVTADLEPKEEQVWARHILVATEDEAKTVLEDLKKGEDWNTLAATYSTDSSNKDNGGDLGWFGRGSMVTAFEDAAFAMKPGEIS